MEIVGHSAPPDLPYDQREEDGGSLTFDGDVLTERMEHRPPDAAVASLTVG